MPFEGWVFAVKEESLWHDLIQLKQLCLDKATRYKWLVMREFSWMNISGVIAALPDNTGSLNGSVTIPLYREKRAQCPVTVVLAQLSGGAQFPSPDKKG